MGKLAFVVIKEILVAIGIPKTRLTIDNVEDSIVVEDLEKIAKSFSNTVI